MRVVSTARGAFAMLLLALNTLFWGGLVLALALVKLVLPLPAVRLRLDPLLNALATSWVSCNNVWMRWTQPTAWDADPVDGLQREAWYLVSCNHQSWVDIFVLQRVFNRRVPLLKFFLKRELIYVPVIGLAWWALDFPFIRRQGRRRLRQRPQLHAENEQNALEACEKFALVPTSVTNFVEGTRFTRRRHRSQSSPYRHLLKPRVGAMATSLRVLGPHVQSLLDVTIVYPDGVPSFWQFLCGRTSRVVVRCRELSVPVELRPMGDETADPQFRACLARWLARIWADKDREIDAILQGTG